MIIIMCAFNYNLQILLVSNTFHYIYKIFQSSSLLIQKEKSDSGCDTQVERFTSQHHTRTTSDGRSGGGGGRRRRRR